MTKQVGCAAAKGHLQHGYPENVPNYYSWLITLIKYCLLGNTVMYYM